jgi:hypothetical protein
MICVKLDAEVLELLHRSHAQSGDQRRCNDILAYKWITRANANVGKEGAIKDYALVVTERMRDSPFSSRNW